MLHRISRTSMGDPLRQELARAFELHKAGRLAQAELRYAAYLAARPDDVDALNNAAVAALQSGELALAISRLEKLIALIPGQAQARNNLGYALMQAGRLPEAVEQLERAIAIDARYATAHNNLGIVYEHVDRRSEAIEAFERALAVDPRYADAAANLAYVLNYDDDTKRARVAANRALAIDPGHLGGRVGIAAADALEGDLDGARQRLEALLPTQPRYPGFWQLLGGLRLWSGDLEAAEVASRQALALDRNDREANFVVSAALLGRADYRQGWRAFEVRPDGVFGTARRFIDVPTWSGEPLDGALLLYCEQGLGDIVQFARFIRLARERVKEVVFLADRQWRTLAPLLETIAGNDRVLTDESALATLPAPPQAKLSVLSLPFLFGIDVDALPGPLPYLSVLPERAALWRPRLAPIARPRVGLTWATYVRRDVAYLTRQKSIPLRELVPVLETPSVNFVSLQLGAFGDLSPIGSLAARVANFTADIRDFGDTAAIIAELDLVISADTSVAHVAGALGKPVWLVDRFNTDWRWRLARDSSPWYPTVRIFRQERFGDWSAPLTRVAAGLREFAG
jgi:tetratricopeptide (TPR) repeat protein